MTSDSQIRKDVLEELQWEPAIDARHIRVDVNEGVVTLAGQIDRHSGKLHAELAAQRVPGVRALVIRIDVVRPCLPGA